MPLCHPATRSFLRIHTSSSLSRCPPCRTLWRQTPPNYSTASKASQRDNTSYTDLQSEYLDFVLGDACPLKNLSAGHTKPVGTNEILEADGTPSQTPDTRALTSKLHAYNKQHGRTAKRYKLQQRVPVSSEQQNPSVQKPMTMSKVDNSTSWKRLPLLAVGMTNKKVSASSKRCDARFAVVQPISNSCRVKLRPFRIGRQKVINASRLELKRKKQMFDLANSANLNLHLSKHRFGPTGIKTVSLGSIRGVYRGFVHQWNQKFAMLSSCYDRDIPRRLRPSQPALKSPVRTATWARIILENIHSGMKDVFAGISTTQTRSRQWREVALWLLYHKPEEMLLFLKATHTPPYPPTSFVQDSLQYLAWHFTNSKHLSQQQISALVETLPVLASREDGEHLRLQDTFCVDLMSHCSEEQVVELYRAVKEHHIYIRWLAWLHFATYFNKNNRIEEGLDAILQAKITGANPEKRPFLSNCSTLLRAAIRQPGGFRVCLRIVDNLVEMGLRLNTQLCNIIMLNAVESGDLKTAFDVYNSFTQHGIRPDMYTFAILLKGCKLSIDDADMLNSTIRDAIEHVQVLKEPVVAVEILHCLALHHTKHHPDSAFDTVADAFAQMYNISALQQLGISFSNLSKPSHPANQRLQPAPQPVRIMLAVYLDNLSLRNQSSKPAYETYQRFRKLADAGVEPFSSMLQQDYIFNAFISAFIQTKTGVLYAAELIKDMQRCSQPGGPAHVCAPTAQTWTIFLHGFSKYGQMKLAEQVLNYMAKQGIKPDQVMWNTLAAGYAGRQDIDGSLDVLRRMEADGTVWDEFTLKGLRRVWDQERLAEELEKPRKMASIDFMADIKEGLVSKLDATKDISAVRNNETANLRTELAELQAEQTSYAPL